MAIYLGTNNLAGLGGGSREDHNGTTTSLSFPDISYMPALVVTSSARSPGASATYSDVEISGGSLDTSSSDYFTHTIPAGTSAVTNQDILNITNANGGALTNLVIKTGSSAYTHSSTTGTVGRPAITIDFIVDGTTTTYVTPSSIYTGGIAQRYYLSYQFISFGGFNLYTMPQVPTIESASSTYGYARTVDAPLLTTYPNFNRTDGLPGGAHAFVNTSFTNNMVTTTLDQTTTTQQDILYTYIQNPVKYHWTFGFPWLKFNSTLQIRISVPAGGGSLESGGIYSYGLKYTF